MEHEIEIRSTSTGIVAECKCGARTKHGRRHLISEQRAKAWAKIHTEKYEDKKKYAGR